jgi:hypothetical protein
MHHFWENQKSYMPLFSFVYSKPITSIDRLFDGYEQKLVGINVQFALQILVRTPEY